MRGSSAAPPSPRSARKAAPAAAKETPVSSQTSAEFGSMFAMGPLVSMKKRIDTEPHPRTKE